MLNLVICEKIRASVLEATFIYVEISVNLQTTFLFKEKSVIVVE